LNIATLGQRGWDRFQTLSGVQFFFDTEFQVLLGHVYYSNSDWALSSINPTGLWSDKPRLDQDGYVSMMSVDIGDWSKKSQQTGKSARESSPDELAHEVWRQITTELGPPLGEVVTDLQFPQPCWYWIDQFIEYEAGRPIRNAAPYLIPILKDWKNRPGAYPWNPNGTSFTWVPGPEMRATQEKLRVWQAGHGGYQVHFDKLVFAGTWTKTFTRMTSMEAASESGRHAVNAILDHYLYAASADADKDLRAGHPISWRMPYGFVDQDLSSPVRLPTPAGDYCFIYDCENREPGDARPTRLLDCEYFDQGLPHPWAISGIDQAAAAASNANSFNNVTYDLASVVRQLRQWRSVVETLFASAPPPPSAPGSKPGPPRSPANIGMYCQSATASAPAPGSPSSFTTAGDRSSPPAPSRPSKVHPGSGQRHVPPNERYA
jgi:hypothetical protein